MKLSARVVHQQVDLLLPQPAIQQRQEAGVGMGNQLGVGLLGLDQQVNVTPSPSGLAREPNSRTVDSGPKHSAAAVRMACCSVLLSLMASLQTACAATSSVSASCAELPARGTRSQQWLISQLLSEKQRQRRNRTQQDRQQEPVSAGSSLSLCQPRVDEREGEPTYRVLDA